MQHFLKIFLVILAIWQVQGQTETTVLITGGGCGRTSQVAGGIVVTHQPIDTLPPVSNDFICFFQMRAVRANQKVRFRFSHFNLTPDECSLSNLTFYDGFRDTDPEVAMICPDTADVLMREYVGTGSWLTIKLQVSSDSADIRSANFSGFYVSYTDDRDPCVNQSAELMCDNGRCIYDVLECDGLDSCGDGTDERTTAPTFCGATTTAAEETTAVSTTTTTTTTIDPGLFSDLTPLYIILTMAFAMLAAYIIYILLSFQWFKTLMVACLHRCCLFGIRKRRIWKEESENKSGKLSRKITPENREVFKVVTPNNDPLPPTSTPVIVPPVFAPTPTANGTVISSKEGDIPPEKKHPPKKESPTKSGPNSLNQSKANATKPKPTKTNPIKRNGPKTSNNLSKKLNRGSTTSMTKVTLEFNGAK